MRLTGRVACIGDRKVADRILVGITERRRTLGRPKHKEENSNKMKFKNWIGKAQNGIIWLRLGRGSESLSNW